GRVMRLRAQANSTAMRIPAQAWAAGPSRAREPLIASESGLPGDHDGLRAMVCIELGKDMVDVIADRVFGDMQPVGDLAIGEPAGDAVEDLPFAARESCKLADCGIAGLLVEGEEVVQLPSEH